MATNSSTSTNKQPKLPTTQEDTPEKQNEKSKKHTKHQHPPEPRYPTNTTRYPTLTQAQINQQTIQNQTGIQTTLDPPTHNNHWGDPIHPVPANTFRIISKNVNSLPTTNNFLHWRVAATAVLEIEANIMCFQETNLRWDNLNHTKAT